MLDINKLSNRYTVRLLCDKDAPDILDFCLQNTQYYEYCGKEPSLEFILSDLHIMPPDFDEANKYYVGFYEKENLVAIMNLLDGYPSEEVGYIGFFMMDKQLQGKNIGTDIIQEVCQYLKEQGKKTVLLGIDKGNPQSTHFWKKNGFAVIKEVEQEDGIVLVAERKL